MRQTILMIEDNPDMLRLNRNLLTEAGYRVLEAKMLEDGRALIAQENPDLIVLDILLPDGNGLDFLEELRRTNDVPVLLLTALKEDEDVVAGLMRGGDDYLPKPYNLGIFLARVAALLRRGRTGAAAEPPLHIGALELRFIARRAYLDNRDLLLEPKEFTLLEMLVKNRGKYLTAEELYEKVWDMKAFGNVHTVHNCIYKMRQKMADYPEVVIKTKRSGGYQIVIDSK